MASGDVVYDKDDMSLGKICNDGGNVEVVMRVATGGTTHIVTVQYGSAGGANPPFDITKRYDVEIKEH